MLLRCFLLASATLLAADVIPPSLIPESKVEPKYSDEARDAKHQGSVLLDILVNSEGLVDDVKIVRPLGYGLDEKAVDAVIQWRFRPATKNGKPVAAKAKVEINFRLADDPPAKREASRQ